MTDITDQDRRVAYEWAASIDHEMDCWSAPTRAIARVILATVDAPAPTLAEEILDAAARIRDAVNPGDRDVSWADMESCADRAAQMGHDLTEARAEVERLTAVQKGAESNAETLDPADVPAGEAWIVECRGERRTAVKDRDDNNEPWNTFNADGWYLCEDNEDVTLITRLVPAPRVITNADELDRLCPNSVILSADNDAWQKSTRTILWSSPWWDASHGGPAMWPSERLCDEDHPVTVLWEPGA